MQELTTLSKDQRFVIISNMNQKENVFVDEIFPLYVDHMRRYVVKRVTKTFSGVSFDIMQTGFNGQPVPLDHFKYKGIYMLTVGSGKTERVITVGHSSYSVAYNVYRFFKEVAGKSRHDETQSAGNQFAPWLKENGFDRDTAVNLYVSPLMFPNKLKKADTKNFLVELKKMFIMKFDPELNEQFVNEVLDNGR